MLVLRVMPLGDRQNLLIRISTVFASIHIRWHRFPLNIRMTDKLYHIIYKTTCRVNGKQYIGVHSTNSLDDKYLGSSKQLQNDIALFGSENFSREILEMCETRDLALSRERVLVNEVWVDRPHTYNLHVGGAAWPYGHRVFSIEHRQKLSEARKKQVRQKHTEEAKRKMSVGKTGKPRPDV